MKQPSILLILFALILSIPLLIVYGSLFLPTKEVFSHLADTVLTDYISNSLLLSIGVGVLSLVLGVALAWLVTMYRFPMSKQLEWALLLPLAMPAYIIAYSYTGILDAAGPLQTWLRYITGWQYHDYWFPEIRSLGGAIIMLSLVLYPYVYLLARAAFIEQSICVLEVARTLGCNTYQTFMRVALPLARPAIVVGLSLVIMETLADYGTVQYFGVDTFTTGIFKAWFSLGSSVAAAQLSALLLTFIIFLLCLERYLRYSARFHHTSSRYSSLPQKQLTRSKAYGAFLFCISPLFFGLLVPIYFLMHWALNTYLEIINAEFYKLLLHSLLLALFTALLALLIGVLMAYTQRNTNSRINHALIRLVSMGYALPGTVIAVGVLIPFAWFDNTLDTFLSIQFKISNPILLSGTLVALIFAYLVRFLAVSIDTVEAGLEKIKPTIDDTARITGVTSREMVQHIHMPMMKGSLLTALLLVFVDIIKELPLTLILRPFNFNTLAVRTYELANEERLAAAAVPALAIVLASIIPVIVISNLISRSRPGYE